MPSHRPDETPKDQLGSFISRDEDLAFTDLVGQLDFSFPAPGVQKPVSESLLRLFIKLAAKQHLSTDAVLDKGFELVEMVQRELQGLPFSPEKLEVMRVASRIKNGEISFDQALSDRSVERVASILGYSSLDALKFIMQLHERLNQLERKKGGETPLDAEPPKID